MTADETSEFVEPIAQACLAGADALLREAGMCPRPTVHMLARQLAQPYIGYLQTRPFYRGADAATAVRTLGLLPSILCATRLVVTWEHADLCTALELPDPAVFPTALVVLDATLDDHVLHWHPFDARLGPAGYPTILPRWGETEHYPAAPLPTPVTRLLAVWREWRAGDLDSTVAELEADGFEVRWAQPSYPNSRAI